MKAYKFLFKLSLKPHYSFVMILCKSECYVGLKKAKMSCSKTSTSLSFLVYAVPIWGYEKTITEVMFKLYKKSFYGNLWEDI